MIRLENIVTVLKLTVLAGKSHMDKEVTGAYASDLLSDVMGNATKGNVWITMQTHGNIAAVATLKELAAIIIVNGGRPDEITLARAESEGIVILGTTERSFTICGQLYKILNKNAMV